MTAIEDNNYKYLQTDRGTKLRNSLVQHSFKKMEWDEVIKTSMVETFNGKLEWKINGYLTFSRQGRFINKLGDMVSA